MSCAGDAHTGTACCVACAEEAAPFGGICVVDAPARSGVLVA